MIEVDGYIYGVERSLVCLELVKTMLADTDEPLENVAYRCGYNYRTRMAAAFRKTVGMTPGQYRKRFRRRGRHTPQDR